MSESRKRWILAGVVRRAKTARSSRVNSWDGIPLRLTHRSGAGRGEGADLGAEGRALEAEHAGGGLLVAAGALEGVGGGAALDGGEGAAVVEAVVGEGDPGGRGAGFAGWGAGKGEVVGIERGAVGAEGHGHLDGVFELPDIAGPGEGAETVEGGGGEALDREGFGAAGPFHEVPGQERDIGGTAAQRWHLDGDDVEAIVKVLAEAAFGDAAGE